MSLHLEGRVAAKALRTVGEGTSPSAGFTFSAISLTIHVFADAQVKPVPTVAHSTVSPSEVNVEHA